jgi:hypothetical protein
LKVMRVLFLDIDGVLNGDEFLDDDFPKPSYKSMEEWMLWWLEAINPVSVKILNEIIKVTDTKVVLSSNRRNWASLEDILIIMRKAGFEGEIVDRTPTCRFQSRGTEIRAWLDENEPNFFIILDDDDDMEGLEPFIKIDPKTGLVPEDVNRVLSKIS